MLTFGLQYITMNVVSFVVVVSCSLLDRAPLYDWYVRKIIQFSNKRKLTFGLPKKALMWSVLLSCADHR